MGFLYLPWIMSYIWIDSSSAEQTAHNSPLSSIEIDEREDFCTIVGSSNIFDSLKDRIVSVERDIGNLIDPGMMWI